MGINSKVGQKAVKTSPTGPTFLEGFLLYRHRRTWFDFPATFCLVAFAVLAWCLKFLSRMIWEHLYHRNLNAFPMQTLPILDSKNVRGSTGSRLNSSPPPLYHWNAQLAFRLWCAANVVELPVFTGAEVSPECSVWDAAQRKGTRVTNVPALYLDQPGVRSASVTFKTPPTSTQAL